MDGTLSRSKEGIDSPRAYQAKSSVFLGFEPARLLVRMVCAVALTRRRGFSRWFD